MLRTLLAKLSSLNFNGSILQNSLSILFLSCLIPKDPFGANLALTIAINSFSIIAAIEHLFPKKLQFLTHVVKSLYSLLLTISLSIKIWITLPIMIVDLLPLLLRNARLKIFSENIGAYARIALIGIGFYKINFNSYVLGFFLICSFIYYKERKERISANVRFEYGWSHHFEHFALLVFFFFLNYENLNIAATIKSLTLLITIPFSIFILLGIYTNIYLLKKNKHSTPEWVDDMIRKKIIEKSRNNLFSKKLYFYFIKPFAKTMMLKKLDWDDIEKMIREMPLHEPVDVVLGVYSGGAFIANYVRKTHNIPEIQYVKSKYWSNSSFIKSIRQVIHLFMHIEPRSIISFDDPDYDFSNKRVLLVDDSVCTSITMKTITEMLYKKKAKKVMQYALFCSNYAKIDYAHTISAIPLIWPWGWEID